MSYGICPLSSVPIRSSTAHKSEMISQLLFGELFEVLERKGRQWLRIRCEGDNFVGWVATEQIMPITPSEFAEFRRHFSISLDLMHPVMAADHCIPIGLGAQLPLFDGLRFRLGEHFYTFSGQAVAPEHIEPSVEFVLKIARKYLHAPYLWGGRSPFGIDSSGLVQMVYKMAGYNLPREPFQQVYLGQAIDFVEQALPGDLAFFENHNERITHVGIIFPDQNILHAYGQVRIDSLDHFGVFDHEKKRYTFRLRVIKRLLPAGAQPAKSEVAGENPQRRKVELSK